jgi:hypothetical protein
MRYLRNRDGFIKPLFIMGMIALAIYVGLQFGTPYYRYQAFKSDAAEAARLSVGSADQVKAEVYKSAKSHQLPLEEEDITVIKKVNTVRVEASWTATIDIFGIYQKTLDFTVNVEE